jgi:hypothetical protein
MTSASGNIPLLLRKNSLMSLLILLRQTALPILRLTVIPTRQPVVTGGAASSTKRFDTTLVLQAASLTKSLRALIRSARLKPDGAATKALIWMRQKLTTAYDLLPGDA